MHKMIMTFDLRMCLLLVKFEESCKLRQRIENVYMFKVLYLTDIKSHAYKCRQQQQKQQQLKNDFLSSENVALRVDTLIILCFSVYVAMEIR